MDIVSYYQAAGYGYGEAAVDASAFLAGYPHSTTYTTPEARRKHFDDQWQYLKGQSKYSFECSFILGKGFPGSAFDCDKCAVRGQRTRANVIQATA
jgi:hypothetical protein